MTTTLLRCMSLGVVILVLSLVQGGVFKAEVLSPSFPRASAKPSNCLDEMKVNVDRTYETNIPHEDIKSDEVLLDVDESTVMEMNGTSRRKRSIKNENKFRWDKGIIPYVFDVGNTEEQITGYLQTMSRYEFYTCLRFVEHTATTATDYALNHNNYLKFLSKWSGCWSYIGNVHFWSGQAVSCCGKGVCVHEIGHAAGLNHEQEIDAREDWVRVNWENISPAQQLWYSKPPLGSFVLERYDLTSAMHYGFGTAMDPLDPRQRYLLRVSSEYYYMFKIISDRHNCQELACPNHKDVVCGNHGYFSTLDGNCQCICPVGLDPGSLCNAIYNGDASLKQKAWPVGSFAMLKPVDGCPSQTMSEGSSIIRTAGAVVVSQRFSVASLISGTDITLQYCVQESAGSAHGDWPKGAYCILRAGGSCPAGFKDGSIEYGDTSSPSSKGTLPDIKLTQKTMMCFCCREDGDEGDPVSFPTSKPFILYMKNKGSCQTVKDMLSWQEYYRIINVDAVSLTVKGSVPKMVIWNQMAYVYSCYYEPLTYGCGEIIELSSSTQTSVTITSPNYPSNYNNNQMCTWLVKAPESDKLMLTFDDYHLETPSTGSGCWDDLEIRENFVGQTGKRYCGDGFATSFMSESNTIMLIFRSNYQVSMKGFSAKVTLLPAESMCFKVDDKGSTYRGNVDFTVDFEQCIPWAEATGCRHHPFKPEDFFDGLDGNKCRNPGHGKRPWCYTFKENCVRNYCDVCGEGICYDLDSTCAIQIAGDTAFCQSENSKRFCRQSCGYCDSIVIDKTPVSQITCSKPSAISDSEFLGPDKSTYSVGDVVQFRCLSDASTTLDSTCLTDGSWSVGQYVCGGCPTGWVSFQQNCYKYFEVSLTYPAAVQVCTDQQALVATLKSQEEMDFVSSIRDQSRFIWIGATDSVVEGEWVWSDGSPMTFNNWATGQPNNFYNNEHCAIMKLNGDGKSWMDVYCTWYNNHAVVCKKSLTTAREICADQITTCENALLNAPEACTTYTDFAYQACPQSCGVCGVPAACDATVPSAGMTIVGGQASLITGQYVVYECVTDHILQSGNLKRVCLKTGQLSGQAPVCILEIKTSWPNNNVVMQSRQRNAWAWWAMLGDNDNMLINRAGKLIAWHFYSGDAGVIIVQIVKPLQRNADNSMVVELVSGKKFDVLSEREYYVELPAEEQIAVEPGYLITLDYHNVGGALRFDLCDPAKNPEGMNWKYGWFWRPEGSGEVTRFNPINSCRIYSLQAIIGA